jgi:protein dithiol oxidoreductase (disulfide-forming)
MQRTLRLGLVTMLLALAACGAKQSAPTSTGPVVQNAPSGAPAEGGTSAAPSTAVPVAAEEAPANANAAAGDEESVGEQPVSISPIARAVAANAPSAAGAIPSKWIDGQNYQTLVPAQPTSVSPGKVEVVEIFWYGCPHCFHFEPLLEEWSAKSKPPFAELALVPLVDGSEVKSGHARLFYTLQALGKVEALHELVFHEIHVNQNYLVASDPARTEQLQKAFLLAHGVSAADFDRTYRSFSVESNLQRAAQLLLRYRIAGVPSVVVNGRYTTDVASAGGESQLITLMTDLATAEHRR